MKQTAIVNFIRQLLRPRGLTLQQLCELLGYRSMTSLTRLMQGSANRSSLVKFSGRLRSCEALSLTQQENNQLDDLIELRDIGDNDFVIMVALRRFLRGESPVSPQETLMLCDESGAAQTMLARYGMMRVQRALILNCEYVPMYHDLALMMEQMDFRIEHLIFDAAEPLHTVHSLHTTVPLLYNRNYSSYSCTIRKNSMHTRGIMVSDMMIIDYLTPDGELRHDLIVFTAPTVGQIVQSSLSIGRMYRLLPERKVLQPIRENVSDSDMLHYIRFCAELERDRAVYRIKPDLGIEQIPIDLLYHAVADAAPPPVLQVLDQLADAFNARQKNVLTKAEPQYHLMKRRAMWAFVKTGRTSDHLWCCRPFTMAERLEILQFLRSELMAKPTFHLHFLKDDDVLLDDEVVLYAERGLSIIKPGTDYNWSTSHAEILITHRNS